MTFNFYLIKLRGAFLSAYEVLFTLFVIVYSKLISRKVITGNLKKLRILQYSEAYTLGGVLKVVERLTLGLGKIKEPLVEQVLVLIDKPEIKEFFEEIAQKNQNILKTHYVKLPSEYFSLREYYYMQKIMQEAQPDIVHLHLYSPHSCRLGILAASMAGVPVITTEHNNSSDTTFRLNVLKRLNQHLIYKIIAVSEAVWKQLIHGKGIDSSKIQCIPNGVDLNFFNGLNSKDNLLKGFKNALFDSDTILVGMVGALHKNKGYDYLLLAVKIIIKKHPNIKFIFIGDGSYRDKLEEITRDLDLKKNVEFLGYIKNVSSYYSIFNMFVLPSLVEGMPLTILEAMAMGVPVVATAVDGSKELVVDGETGLLVPPKDVNALSGAIEYMIENQARAKEMGIAGRKRVQNKYNLQENIKQTFNVYMN